MKVKQHDKRVRFETLDLNIGRQNIVLRQPTDGLRTNLEEDHFKPKIDRKMEKAQNEFICSFCLQSIRKSDNNINSQHILFKVKNAFRSN